jgi:hypothetical protein
MVEGQLDGFLVGLAHIAEQFNYNRPKMKNFCIWQSLCLRNGEPLPRLLDVPRLNAWSDIRNCSMRQKREKHRTSAWEVQRVGKEHQQQMMSVVSSLVKSMSIKRPKLRGPIPSIWMKMVSTVFGAR